MSEQEDIDRMRLTSRTLPVRHGDDSPVPRIMMLKSDHDKALAAKDKQLATQADLLRSVREENRKLALSVSSQSLRIAELERYLASTSEQAIASQRQQIIDEMVKPLMETSDNSLNILDHIGSAEECYCDKSVGYVCEKCEAHYRATEMRRVLAAVKSKLTSIEKEKQ